MANPNPENWSPEFKDTHTAYPKTEEREGRCNAKLVRDGVVKYCHKYPIRGRNRCKFHGGMTPVGHNHANFKDGRSSKYMPQRLYKRYEEFLNDEKLLQLRNEIAVIDSRLSELVESLDEAEDTAELWYEVRKLVKALLRYHREGRTSALGSTLLQLSDIVDRGASKHEMWDQIMDTIQHRRKTVESERRRLVETHQMITTEQALAMIEAIGYSIKKYVHDRQALQYLSSDLARIASKQAIAGSSR